MRLKPNTLLAECPLKWGRITALLLAITITLVSASANAIISPVTIEPTAPSDTSFVRMTVSTSFCDVFLTLGPTDRTIEINGNVIRVIVNGFFTNDFAQCNNPLGTYTYDIGVLPANHYRLELYRRFSFEPFQVDLERTTNFTVSAAALPLVAQVPAISTFGIASLCGLMLMIVYGTQKWFSS